MKYVLDSSVALKVVLPEPDSAKATQLIDAHQKRIHELLAPDILLFEISHALTRAERKGLIHLGEAEQKLRDVLIFAPPLRSGIALLSRAVELSSQSRVGVYDCVYVALAEREGCELVTADRKLIHSLPSFPIVDLAHVP